MEIMKQFPKTQPQQPYKEALLQITWMKNFRIIYCQH